MPGNLFEHDPLLYLYWHSYRYSLFHQLSGIISVCLGNRPFFYSIKPNFFKIRNCFFTDNVSQWFHFNLLCSFFKWTFGSKFVVYPLFSPLASTLLRSFFLDTFTSKSLNAVLITSLAELYLPEDTSLDINSSKYSPSKIEVLRAI